MGADELLRRYLAQQRELGERELVLDKLSADEARRLLAGAGATAPVDRVSPGSAEEPPPARRELPAEGGDPAVDWRATLLAAGAAPPSQRRAVTTAATASGGGAREPDEAPRRDEMPAKGRHTDSPPAAGSERRGELPAPAGLVVGATTPELFGGPLANVDTLDAIAELVRGCTRCPLYATATNGVPGEGHPRARLMCVGEAPGANEDATGRPFVGQAGQLLTKILAAINLTRDEVFIANVLKHRPPGNRNPRPEEVEACRPYLIRQLELVQPQVIVAFGTFAAQTLLETKLAIGKLRGQIHRYRGVPLVVTYHPAALLRNPAWKRPTWEDVQLARRILDSAAA